MENKIGFGQVGKKIGLSVFAQIISLAVSFVLNLIVPKIIDEHQYAYWQTYVLYISYVGILHFGLLDGIVLRYSQYNYEELDRPRLRSQFQLLLGFTSFIAFAGICIAFFFDEITKEILILLACGVITKNIFAYTSYTFQITNRIHKYAFLVVSQKLFYGVGVGVLLLLGAREFYWFCIFDLLGDLFGTVLGAFYNRGLYFGKTLKLRDVLTETRLNISSGAMLLVANWSSMLLVGSAKMMVQWHFDDLVFGKVSFAFSLSNLFLSFVTAISVVLFPTLKRMEPEQLPRLYRTIRDVISPFLFFIMLLYFPGSWILERWLPAYEPSLVYLGILLPIVVYSSKVSLLTNNYLKAYRKERMMLIVNLISILVALLLFSVCVFLFENLTALLICVVLVIMLRSVASEVIVMRLIGDRFILDFITEGIMTVAFIVSASAFDLFWGFCIYAAALVAYLVYNRKTIRRFFTAIRTKLKGLKGHQT